MPMSGLEIFASQISDIEIEGDYARFTITSGDNTIYIRTTRSQGFNLSGQLAQSARDEHTADVECLPAADASNLGQH